MTNCFYCQSLNEIPTKLGLCEFCGEKGRSPEVPLYQIYYLGKVRYFCCQCVWWRLPHSQAEKEAENQWYQAQKQELAEQLNERAKKRIENFLNCHDTN